MAAGAVIGAFDAAVSGGNLGQNMVTSAISAGMAKGLGNYLPEALTGNEFADFGIGLVGHAAIGGVTGGSIASLYGGSFGQGFEEGAKTGAYGYAFNNLGLRVLMYGSRALQWFRALLSRPSVDPNKLHHIFGKPDHNLDSIVAEFGSREAAFHAIQRSTEAAVRSLNVNGVFELSVNVGRQ